MEIVVPEIWLEFGKFTHLGFLELYPDFRSGVVEFACSLDKNRFVELQTFIRDLLESNAPPAELSVIWEASRASFFVDEHEMSLLFSEIAAGLEQCRSGS